MAKVLYAEDDSDHRLMMRAVFKGLDITLIEAVNGEDALEKVHEYQPDLILLDLLMPKIDGFGVLTRLKSSRFTRHIPVIILSAWPTGDNRQRLLQAGAKNFVTKPYDPIQFAQYVKQELDAITISPKPQATHTQTRPLPSA
jgi:CheY-like chemotaxis protein